MPAAVPITAITPHERRPAAGCGVGGPVSRPWREGTLTRAKELESLCAWARLACAQQSSHALLEEIMPHLDAAREAALGPGRRFSDEARLVRALSNLGAAETLLLDVAPTEYVLARVPGLLNDVQRHLAAADPRRQQMERIAARVGVCTRTQRPSNDQAELPLAERLQRVDQERLGIAAAAQAASSAALREQIRLRSFRKRLVVTTLLLTLLAAAVAVLGFVSPTTIPLCFQPEKSGQTVVVCPTAQSALLPTVQRSGPAAPDVDDVVRKTAAGPDLFVVELVGLAAAAVAAAAAIRNIRGSSEPHGLPVALAVLKLPTGAITALLGLLLMRGQFVPGLSALDTSAQILAWALVFGYAQQLFTRLVDQQAHNVLDAVRGGGTPAPTR